MRETERRIFAQPVELRKGTDKPVLGGYASKYMRYSQNLGGFVEQVVPTAFRKSLADGAAIVARYNHDDNYLLGTTEAGTLRLLSDDEGLLYDVDLPDTQAGRDVAVLAARGDLRYSSFAFRVLEDEWTVTDHGFPLRSLINVQLLDVAPVNTPAYLDSTAGLRSLAAAAHMTLDELAEAAVEDVRAGILLRSDPEPPAVEPEPEPGGQGDTHLLTLRQRELDLLK